MNEDISLFDLAPEVEAITEADPFKPEDIPASANVSTVKDKAEKTSKTIDATKSVLKSKITSVPGMEEVVEVLMRDEELKDISEPPSLLEVRHEETYAVVLDELQSIIDKYKNGFDFETVDEDVIRMAAFLADLSQQLAIFQAQAQDTRSREERLRNRAYVKAKEAANKENAKLTDMDAKELSKFMSLELSERAANLEFIEKYLFNSFHSIRNFVELLNFVAGRKRRADATGAQL